MFYEVVCWPLLLVIKRSFEFHSPHYPNVIISIFVDACAEFVQGSAHDLVDYVDGRRVTTEVCGLYLDKRFASLSRQRVLCCMVSNAQVLTIHNHVKTRCGCHSIKVSLHLLLLML